VEIFIKGEIPMTDTNTNEVLARLEALIASQAQNNQPKGEGYTVTLGITRALIRSAFDRRQPRQMMKSVTGHLVATNAPFKTASGEKSQEQSKVWYEKLHAAAASVSSVVELNIAIDFETLSEMAEAMDDDDVPMSYAHFTFSILEAIEGRKVQNSEGVTVIALRAGVATDVSDPVRANNPMADSSVLADDEELMELLVARAAKSRSGFDTWKKGINAVATAQAKANAEADTDAEQDNEDAAEDALKFAR